MLFLHRYESLAEILLTAIKSDTASQYIKWLVISFIYIYIQALFTLYLFTLTLKKRLIRSSFRGQLRLLLIGSGTNDLLLELIFFLSFICLLKSDTVFS